jgi:carboxyl-terminal processing protease
MRFALINKSRAADCKSRLPVWKKIGLSAVVATLALPAWSAYASVSSDRMQQVLEILSTSHVSGASEEALSDAAIQAMVQSLNDPYTEFMDKKQWSQFEGSLARNYVGVGILISHTMEGVYIEQVFNNSSAEAAGLRVDDIIVKVNDTEITADNAKDVVTFITGEENSNVTITVLRGGERLALTMPRKAVSLPVVDSAYLDGGVGYLRVFSFSDNSDEQFTEILDGFRTKSDFRSLVIDLRDNPGGLLESAGYMASNFIKDKILIHTKTRNGTDNPVNIVGGTTLSQPVYVLVNENSASASEILAGALQDYKVAVIAGTNTYGKGSVQNIYSLSEGSKLKVTIEEYLTPLGHPVNKVGIKPDLELEGSMNQLLHVLRLAGVQNFNVEKKRSVVTVNGMKVEDSLPAVEENGKLWVHSRVLAALAGAELKWVPESQGVELSVKGQAPVLMAGSEAKMAGDYLLLDAAAFAQSFPGVKLEGTLDHLVLSSAAVN